MSIPTSKHLVYDLHVKGAALGQRPTISKPPKLQLKIATPGARVCKLTSEDTFEPEWDRHFRFRVSSLSTVISFQIKRMRHLRLDEVLGDIEISVGDLMNTCKTDNVAMLEISKGIEGRPICTLAICITASDEVQDFEGTRKILSGVQLDAQSSLKVSRPIRVQSPGAPIDAASPPSDFMQTLGTILSRMQTLSNYMDKLSQVHPYITTACEIVSAVQKGVQRQMEIDESIVDITDVMAEILGFVEDVEYTKDKLMRLETTIVCIMKEIGDCVSFVREYLQSSFVVRLAKMPFSNKSKEIEGFKARFSDLDARLHKSVVVRILHTVEDRHSSSQIPFSTLKSLKPSPFFTGRQAHLKQLSEYFDTSNTTVHCRIQRRFTLYGLGGTGKTQIARKFISSHLERFSAIYIIDATNANTIIASLGHIGISFGENNADSVRIMDLLCAQENEWLLLFENASIPWSDLQRFFPPCSHGNILITSGDAGLCSLTPSASLSVSEMEHDDAVSLLLKIATQPSSDANRLAASGIVHELGHLALAVVQAGSYIQTENCSLTQFSNTFKEQHTKLLDGQVQDDYRYTIRTVWESDFNKLCSLAQQLLKICSFLHGSEISSDIFRRAVCDYSLADPVESHAPLNPGATVESPSEIDDLMHSLGDKDGDWDDSQFGQLLSGLHSLSFVIMGDRGVFSVRPLVQSWLLDRMSAHEVDTLQRSAAWLLYHSLPSQEFLGARWRRDTHEHHLRKNYRFVHTDKIASRFSKAFSSWGAYQEVAELQLLILRVREEKFGKQHVDTLVTMASLASAYRQLGRYSEAKDLQLQVLESRRQLLGDQHLDTILAMHCLAITHRFLGQYSSAKDLQISVLETRKHLLSDSHPDTLWAMGNLALTYKNLGQFSQAKELELQVLDTRKQSRGDKHQDTLTAMRNLALTYRDLGQYSDAESLQKQVFESQSLLLGERHPDTVWAMSNLALTYVDLGHYSDAMRLQERVLALRKQLQSDKHPDTLSAMGDLASTYRYLGKYSDAKDLESQVLESRNQLLGTEHPSTLRAMINLAITNKKLAQYSDAKDLELRVLELRKQQLGGEHPDTLNAMRNLALTYRHLGQYSDAESLQTRVLDLQERILGSKHPDTIWAMANLAETYRRLGRYAEAKELEIRVLDLRKNLFGDQHPDSLAAMSSLAATYRVLEQYMDARILQEQVLESRKQTLGDQHPNTISIMYSLALTYRDLNRHSDAKSLQERVLEFRKKVLGEEHSDTLWAMGSLGVTYRQLRQYSDARYLQSQVVKIRKRVSGEHHPDTLTAMHNLAMTYRNLRQYLDAKELQVPVLEERKRILGCQHPDTLWAMGNLALTLRNLGQIVEARDLEEQVLESRKKLLGDKHPATITAERNLAVTLTKLNE